MRDIIIGVVRIKRDEIFPLIFFLTLENLKYVIKLDYVEEN